MPSVGAGTGTLRSVRTRAGEITLTDDGPTVIAAPGNPGAWTVTGPVATTYAWSGGLLLIDVAFVETPHRLHLTLDPVAGSCTAAWQTEPLGRFRLAELRMPR